MCSQCPVACVAGDNGVFSLEEPNQLSVHSDQQEQLFMAVSQAAVTGADLSVGVGKCIFRKPEFQLPGTQL